MSKIIRRCRGKNLHFSTSIEENISKADMIFISVNTPTTSKKGLGAGKASDLKWVEASARQVAKYSPVTTIVVEKSTLPVRTAEAIITILKSSKKATPQGSKTTFDVLLIQNSFQRVPP